MKWASSPQDDPVPLVATLETWVRLLTEGCEMSRMDPDLCALGCLFVKKTMSYLLEVMRKINYCFPVSENFP